MLSEIVFWERAYIIQQNDLISFMGVVANRKYLRHTHTFKYIFIKCLTYKKQINSKENAKFVHCLAIFLTYPQSTK